MPVLKDVLGKAEAARESVANATNVSPEKIKKATFSAITRAYGTIRGSGSVGQELKEVGRALIDAPVQIVSAVPKAMGQLLTVQPINLTKNVFGTTASLAKDVAKVCVAPIPAGIATIQQGLGMAKKAGAGLINAPLKVGRLAQNGCSKILGMLDDALSVSPSAPSAPSAPSPATT